MPGDWQRGSANRLSMKPIGPAECGVPTEVRVWLPSPADRLHSTFQRSRDSGCTGAWRGFLEAGRRKSGTPVALTSHEAKPAPILAAMNVPRRNQAAAQVRRVANHRRCSWRDSWPPEYHIAGSRARTLAVPYPVVIMGHSLAIALPATPSGACRC